MARQRGKPAAAHLAVIGPGGIVPTMRRPAPPASLTAAEAAEWKAIVNRMPADWFPRETHPMLVQLCRLTTCAHDIADLMADAKKARDGRVWQQLLRQQISLTEGIARLSTRMRISQQSTYDREKRKGYEPKYDPWTGLMGGDDDAEEKETDAR